MKTISRFLLLTGLLALALPVAAQFLDEEVARDAATEQFLAEAEITASVQMSQSEGVTEPWKLTLSDGNDERFAIWKNVEGRKGGFWEGWQYEIAAYRLDRYLGLNMVPPTVERRFEGSRGSIQSWVEFWINMREYSEKKMAPPGDKSGHWNNVVYLQRAFDNLIANEDRHLGNILLTEDWRMILIDHSRSFRSNKKNMTRLIFTEKHPEGPKVMKRLPRSFVDKIKALDTAKLTEIAGEYLNEKEVEAVLARRDLILETIDKLIAKNGESSVIY